MSKSNATVIAEPTIASSVAHPPAPMLQRSPEENTAAASTFIQRSVNALGGGSPQASPENYVSALGHLQGSPSLQTGIMRKLQRSYGNSYVGGVIQTKLTVNQPGDIYEQEADRVADIVMRMPNTEVAGISDGAAGIQRTCAACAGGQGLCPNCAEEKRLQRQPLAAAITPLIQREGEGTTNNAPQVTPQIAAIIESLRGGGQPLPASARAFFEPRFGADFSNVRVHTDARAAETANSVSARAFTVGRDVVFGGGEYVPESSAGRQLLAHELTHVVQQNATGTSTIHRVATTPPTLEFDDCPTGWQDMLSIVSARAQDWLDNAITGLSSLPRTGPLPTSIANMLRIHFRTTNREHIDEILDNFQTIRSRFSEGIEFECESECDPEVGAYVPANIPIISWILGGSDVHVCPPWFNDQSGSRDQPYLDRTVTIIHEVAHEAAGLGDVAQVTQAHYPGATPEEAIDNAESYAVFARDAFLGRLHPDIPTP